MSGVFEHLPCKSLNTSDIRFWERLAYTRLKLCEIKFQQNDWHIYKSKLCESGTEGGIAYTVSKKRYGCKWTW